MDSYEASRRTTDRDVTETFYPVDLNWDQFDTLENYFKRTDGERQDTEPGSAQWGVRIAVGPGGPRGRNALLVNGLYLHTNGEFATFPESDMLAEKEEEEIVRPEIGDDVSYVDPDDIERRGTLQGISDSGLMAVVIWHFPHEYDDRWVDYNKLCVAEKGNYDSAR